MVKVLKDTLDMQQKLKENEEVVAMEVDSRSEEVDTDDSEWRHRENRKRI